MPNTYIALADPLIQDTVPRNARVGKALAFLSLFIGLGYVVLWSGGDGQNLAIQKPITTMALPFMQPAKASQSMRTMQATLRKFGVPPSPFENLALAALDCKQSSANQQCGRNVAMMASKMDRNTQVQLASMASAVEVKADQLAGVTAPVGFFDPVGFSTGVGGTELLFLREAELKHGRVGMIASLGLLVGEKFHPVYPTVDVPAGTILGPSPGTSMGPFLTPGTLDLPGLYKDATLDSFWPALFLLCGGIEFIQGTSANSPYEPFSGYKLKEGWSPSGALPGDYGWDPLGLKPTEPAALLEMQNKEINNGRLAMLAAAGMIAQELVDGQKIR